MLPPFDGPTKVGLAHSAYVPDFVRDVPGWVDFVEMPFELLHYSPGPVTLPCGVPVLLHSSSLSLAGTVPPAPDIVDAVAAWSARTDTAWVGEHLAFITAEATGAMPYDVGYTINPPLNAETVERIRSAVVRFEHRLGRPLVLENPPVYFTPPGSTMSPVEFTSALCAVCPAGLLLDVAHFFITCQNLGYDPFEAVVALPLDRVVEVHLSGVEERDGAWWDDHTVAARPEVHELLRTVLSRTHVAAVTLEYNWNGGFSTATLVDELDKVRRSVGRGVAA